MCQYFSDFSSKICFSTICDASAKYVHLLTHFSIKLNKIAEKKNVSLGPRISFWYYHVGYSQYTMNDVVLLSPKGAIGQHIGDIFTLA